MVRAVSFDFLFVLSKFFEYYSIFVFLAFLAISLFTTKKRAALLLALALAVVAGTAVKNYYHEDRPCVSEPSPISCPGDYGLPSNHAIASTIFAVGALGSPVFLLFAPAAFLIGYSRIYLNVHSIEQVAGGFALGIALYSFAAGLRARVRRETPFSVTKQNDAKPEKWSLEKELRRQALHLLFGVTVIALALFFGMQLAVILLASALVIGIFGVGLVMLQYKVPLAAEILDAFERKKVVPGKGAMHYAAGCLLLMTFAPADFALAMIAVLAFGDGASTVAGKIWGKKKLPWNSGKSWVGTAAFFAFGAVSAAFFLPFADALAYSLLLALIETVPADVDDNLLIPVSGLVLQAGGKALFGV